MILVFKKMKYLHLNKGIPGQLGLSFFSILYIYIPPSYIRHMHDRYLAAHIYHHRRICFDSHHVLERERTHTHTDTHTDTAHKLYRYLCSCINGVPGGDTMPVNAHRCTSLETNSTSAGHISGYSTEYSSMSEASPKKSDNAIA